MASFIDCTGEARHTDTKMGTPRRGNVQDLKRERCREHQETYESYDFRASAKSEKAILATASPRLRLMLAPFLSASQGKIVE